MPRLFDATAVVPRQRSGGVHEAPLALAAMHPWPEVPAPLSRAECIRVPPGSTLLQRPARPAAQDERTRFGALVERAGLDPASFDFTVHPIRQSADLGWHAERMVTVTCRAARISRTYLSRAQGAQWLAELADDLGAQVYRR